ncbi:hypothetical protein DB30_02714 [Enhygromyxa salina]|uniref:DUF309 domain-containing protein n=1 Tax=Enhygromyxa salina TaxID=215803 RepID=A0A0C2A7E6_9BACT|nr:hypothetical protein DB30_02714 [Enhygromyxa salina]
MRAHPDYRWGVDLYNHRCYWEAHESWESLWRQATQDTAAHMFLQGLIQCAAAALKAHMGQAAACRALADRGLAKLHGALDSVGGDRYAGLDLRAFTADFRGFVELALGSSEPPQLHLVAR